MTEQNAAVPVLIIDGALFADFEGFTREFSRLLDDYPWHDNLDAFNDILRGGFGTPENGWVLRWINSGASRTALGYEATARRLEQLLLSCHPSNRSSVEARIRSARSGQGPTLFDEIVEIIREHGRRGATGDGRSARRKPGPGQHRTAGRRMLPSGAGRGYPLR